MKKTQLLLTAGAVLLVVLIYQLPRVVVENNQLQEVSEPESHSMEIPSDVASRMAELRRLVLNEENIDKKAKFAHSLANYYLDYGVFDSAVIQAGNIDKWLKVPNEQSAEIYFKAFERAQNQEDLKTYGDIAREKLTQLLDKDPTNLLLKNRLAMTLVTTDNPMAGINMLREILAEDENNRKAIMNLGLLAIQSGQFERAKDRFEKLILLDSADHEAKLYLAVSLIEINKQSQARLLLEEILSSKDSIPAIKVMAMDYLNEL